MKNRFYYLVLILFLVSCQDEQQLQKKASSTIKVVDGRLMFMDESHFVETMSSLQQGNTDVIDGRVLGLDYKSYFSTLEDLSLNSDDFQILDIFEYRVLLNHNREVQIGQKLYAIDNTETKVYNLNFELIDVIKNEISYYNRETKSFKSKDLSSGKSFGATYSESFGYEIDGSTQYGVRYRYIRVGTIVLSYYYETEYHRPLNVPQQTVVEYFEREISDCEISTCQFQTSNPYGGITYNVSKVRYACGASYRSHEVIHGVALRAVYWVKPYDKNAIYVEHQDGLDIP